MRDQNYNEIEIEISRPVGEIISWFQTQDHDDLNVTINQAAGREWRIEIHAKSLGLFGESNLGEFHILPVGEGAARISMSDPPAPETDEAMSWAYPDILADYLRDFLQGDPENLLLQVVSSNRLFLGYSYHGHSLYQSCDLFSTYMESRRILGAVSDELIQPIRHRKTVIGDTWQSIAKDFYGDEAYTPQLIAAMAELGIQGDVEPDKYLPYVYLIKTQNPQYSISQINHAIEFLQELGDSFEVEDDEWTFAAAFFGLRRERLIEIMVRIFEFVESNLEEPGSLLKTKQLELKKVRQRRQSEMLSALQTAFFKPNSGKDK